MIFEKVNFNEEEVKKMSAEEFEERHISLFWQDRDVATRKKMLNSVYGLINKPANEPKPKSKTGE